ncbi:MAG: murein L,D-transpeptidase catalytic domain family protein [Verrucomicrobiaceae bacterium]|nr:murein L,D-transpeptidase catalytic domain family protein [Verrucomicrobiaceae bacterium]
MKSLFPKQEWTDFALAEIKANGLDKLMPADAPDFRIDGTLESWVHLMTAIAKPESGFDPKQTFKEKGDLEGVISTGLFQLSYSSVRAYAKFARSDAITAEMKAATTEGLKDPFFNIRAAAVILQRWVKADGVIASEASPWLGGARYWSVLRKGAPKVKAVLKTIAGGLAKPDAAGVLGAVALKAAKKPSARALAAAAAAPGPNTPDEVARAFAARQNLGSGCNWIFEVDYSINSKFPRLFVYSISANKLYKYKCAHGSGGKNGSPHDGRTREVSNVPNSFCSSLGVIKTGVHFTSGTVGQAVKLNGLSPTNSNMLARAIYLHGAEYVSDNEAGTDTTICGRSLGCIAVSERYIDRQTGGELIDWLKDGSIGVAHYAGAFKLPG